MSDRYWTVVGYDHGRMVFERDIAVDDIAESTVKALLQRLAARGLGEEEIVAASIGGADEGPLSVGPLGGETYGFATAPAGERHYVAVLGERRTVGKPGDRHAFYAAEID